MALYTGTKIGEHTNTAHKYIRYNNDTCPRRLLTDLIYKLLQGITLSLITGCNKIPHIGSRYMYAGNVPS